MSEAMRMRRIYKYIDYYPSLKHLKDKCFKPKFSGTIALDIIGQAKSWVDRFDPVKKSKSKKRKQNKPVCVTQFPKLVKSNEMKKRLQSNVKLVYKRPRILGNLIRCYRKLSFDVHEGIDGDMSWPCGKCALWGNHASNNCMVSLIKHIRTPNGEHRLKQKLDFMSLRYLHAPCKNCDNYYVEQTMTSKQCNVGLNCAEAMA